MQYQLTTNGQLPMECQIFTNEIPIDHQWTIDYQLNTNQLAIDNRIPMESQLTTNRQLITIEISIAYQCNTNLTVAERCEVDMVFFDQIQDYMFQPLINKKQLKRACGWTLSSCLVYFTTASSSPLPPVPHCLVQECEGINSDLNRFWLRMSFISLKIQG